MGGEGEGETRGVKASGLTEAMRHGEMRLIGFLCGFGVLCGEWIFTAEDAEGAESWCLDL